MTTFLGFGAATLVGKANIGVASGGKFIPNQNLAAPLLAREARRRGLPVVRRRHRVRDDPRRGRRPDHRASSSAFAHDIWFNVVKRQREDEREQVLVARIDGVP